MPRITHQIEEALDHLRSGNPVALPTETVYGLAADAQQPKAIQSVYSLKQRPLDHPLILHVAPEWNLDEWVSHIPAYAQALMQSFWPGPLTLVLNCWEHRVLPMVRGGQTSVAIRCPNHPMFLSCLRAFGSPLVAPSANPYGKVSPTSAEHVADSFADSDLLIIEGGRCQVGIESTIVDARKEGAFSILRHGNIDHNQISQVAGINPSKSDRILKVSGHLKTHYQPNKPLLTFTSDEQRRSLLAHYDSNLFLIDHDKPQEVDSSSFLRWPRNSEQAAYELYHQLRTADKSDALVIAIRMPPPSPDWAAVRERILKARQNDA